MLDIRAGFAVLRARFGLPPHAAREDAPFCWGEEKLNAHRHRLERQLTAITAEQSAVEQDYLGSMHALRVRRDACLIELAMTDLYAQAPQRQGKPDAAEPALTPNTLAPPSFGKPGAASTGPGSAETPALPEHGYDPGNGPPVPASLSVAAVGSASDHVPPSAPILSDGASSAPIEPVDQMSDPNQETIHATVEAAAPGWVNVRTPPKSVRERFPFCEMPIARLEDLDRLELIELLALLPKEYDDLIRSTPLFEDHLDTWFWTDDGAACRTALGHTIAREEARRAVWNHLLEWYWCVLSFAPGGYVKTNTQQQADEAYGLLQLEYRNASPPEQHEVWDELTMLFPKRRWTATGKGVEV